MAGLLGKQSMQHTGAGSQQGLAVTRIHSSSTLIQVINTEYACKTSYWYFVLLFVMILAYSCHFDTPYQTNDSLKGHNALVNIISIGSNAALTNSAFTT